MSTLNMLQKFKAFLMLAVGVCPLWVHAVDYYINDTSTVGDVYTSAVGSDANSGTNSASPLLTVNTLLSTYNLEPGDTVWIDTGSYTQAVAIGTGDQGSGLGYVSFIGNTNELGATTFITTGFGWDLNGASYVDVSHIAIKNASRAFYLRSGADAFRSSHVEIIDCDEAIRGASADFADLSYWLIRQTVFNAGSEGLVILTGCDDWTISKSVFYKVGIAFFSGTPVTVDECVFMEGKMFAGTGTPQNGDYNVFWNNAWSASFTTLSEVQKNIDGWWNSVVINPGFANAAAGDFHPLSPAGRWNPGTTNFITTDLSYGMLVDFGDPAGSFAQEQSPNGGRVNSGLFANTAEASKGRTNQTLVALTYNDGGTLDAGSDKIYWYHSGFSNETVRIDYSGASGADGTWQTAATNLPATNGMYTWSNTNFSSSIFARWRIVCEDDTNIVDAVDGDFVFRNGAFVYYVNDASLAGDVFTTAVGHDGNLGTDPGNPKRTLQAILSTYDLEPGDEVRIDSGTYTLSSTLVVGAGDSGSSTNNVRLTGVPDQTIYVGNGVLAQTVWQLDSVSHVLVSDIIFTGGRDGVELKNSTTGVDLNGIRSVNNSRYGVVSATVGNSITRSVLKGNGSYGVFIDNGGLTIQHSVFYGNTLGAILTEGTATLSHNIFDHSTRTGGWIFRLSGLGGAITGNDNAYHLSQESRFARLDQSGRYADDLSAWIELTGNDAASLEADPLFENPGNDDFHLRSAAGRWNGTSFVLDDETSPLIDAGSPAAGFSQETPPHGGRLNIGLYGGTDEASRSPVTPDLRLASPIHGGWIQGDGVLSWKAYGSATGHTLKVEASIDGGDEWTTLTHGVAATNEVFLWDSSLTNDSPAVLWRVVSEVDTNLLAQSSEFFAIRNHTNFQFVVNDASTNDDVYASAVGASTNYVANAAAPLDSLAKVYALYDLEPGDSISVDTGYYLETNNIVIGIRDSGLFSSAITVQGPSGLDVGDAVIEPENLSAGLEILEGEFNTLQNITVQGAVVGIKMDGGSGVELQDVVARSNSSHGVELTTLDSTSLRRIASYDNGGRGVSAVNASSLSIDQSVLWSNAVGGVRFSGGSGTVENSVLQASDGATALAVASGATVVSDYNHFDVEAGGVLAQEDSNIFAVLIDWQRFSTNDMNSFSGVAGFGDSDFHPKTTVSSGRYSKGSGYVTNDLTNSPLIDTGSPGGAFALETSPNGGRVNKGIYGNTGQSSLSRTNGWFLALTLSDGGSVRGTNSLNWIAGGSATGHTVTVQLSLDGGLNWSNLVTGLPANSSSYTWDTTDVFVNIETRWRIRSDVDTNLFDQTDQEFIINNGPVTFYVNDASTTNDVFTTVPGSAGNSGVSSNAPKASVQGVLNNYFVRPIDQILIDSGTYTPGAGIVLEDIHAAVTNRFLVSGAPNGFSVFQNVGFSVENSSAVHLKDLVFDGVSSAITLNRATNTLIEGVRIFDGSTGVHIGISDGVTVSNTIIANASSRGVYVSGDSDNAKLRNVVLHENRRGVWMDALGGSLSVENCVIAADGSGRYLYYLRNGSLSANYNSLSVTNGALVAWVDSTSDTFYQNVSRWESATGRDSRSLRQDEPLFVDADAGDYHLWSEGGRFTNEVFVFDSTTSPLLDGANPSAGSGMETVPNGGRGNIGAFGFTDEASRTSSSTGQLVVISFNDGGAATAASQPLYWNAIGSVTNSLVTVEYSPNLGATWLEITNNVPATNGVVLWDTTVTTSSVQALWRVRESAGSIVDTTDSVFTYRNPTQDDGRYDFFVNDASITDDVYSSAPGDSLNSGAFDSEPVDDVQLIFDQYEVLPGDRIFIDSGVYTQSTVVVAGSFDRGLAANPIRLIGSTNLVGTTSWIVQNGLRFSGTRGYSVENLSFSNVSTAVSVQDDSSNISFTQVDVWNPGTGFDIVNSDNITFTNSLVAGASNRGIYNRSNATGSRWINGVLWKNAIGLHVNSGSFVIQNTAIVADGSGDTAYQYDNGTLVSDYNNIFITNGAHAAVRGNFNPDRLYETVSRWRRDEGKDSHSLTENPGFVNAPQGDFHLMSSAGRFDPVLGGFTNDLSSSALVDAGNPALSAVLETLPNGARINIGKFGGTVYASRTTTNVSESLLTAITASDGGRVEGVINLNWAASGPVTGHTATIEYSNDGGATWTNIVSGINVADGVYSWNTDQPQFISSPLGVWRITSDTLGSLTDQTDSLFALRNDPLLFYVNDLSLSNDVYTTAIGSDGNPGVSSNAPRRSIPNLLSTYDLEPGDAVFVDSGVFDGAITFTQFDAGSGGNPLVIQGAVGDASHTVINGLSAARAITLDEAPGVTLRNLTLSNAVAGVRVDDSDSARLESIETQVNSLAFDISKSSGTQVNNASVRGGAKGLKQDLSSGTTSIGESVFWGNATGLDVDGGLVRISNSVIRISGSNNEAYSLKTVGGIQSDYNNLQLENGAAAAVIEVIGPDPDITVLTVSRWARDYNRDIHSLSHDSLFVDPANGDFHPFSTEGRYTNGLFVVDGQTSPLIDAGNVATSVADESLPNGSRVNIGLYGGTVEASRTPSAASNSVFTAITANDGGRLEGVVNLYWTVSGPATGHTVRVEYSSDGGDNWVEVSTNLPASTGTVLWDTTTFTSSIQALWRVVSESNTNLLDQTDEPFALRNDPIPFYVNDALQVDDVYTSAPGHSTNSGLSASSPRASIQTVLNDYDLEPGDTIFVDTGNFNLTSQIDIGEFDQGTAGDPVVIQGSTNDINRTVLSRSGGTLLNLDNTKGITVRDLALRLASTGVFADGCESLRFEHVRWDDLTTAIELRDSSSVVFQNSLVRDSNTGLFVDGTTGVSWGSGVFWKNDIAYELEGGSLAVENSSINVDGDADGVLFLTSGSFTSDYNHYDLNNGALFGYVLGGSIGGGTQRFETVGSWVTTSGRGQDVHSLTGNPLFEDPNNNDFHLQTSNGQYTPGVGFTTNALSSVSPLMDAGNPSSSFSSESAPNGGRINIGMFGNTDQASQTPTNGVLQVVSLNDGGSVSGTYSLLWTALGEVTDDNLDLDISTDGGVTWSNVAVVPASDGAYAWDSAPFGASPLTRWRITSQIDSGISDESETFSLRNGTLTFYVNDSSALDDEYTSDVGKDSADGASPATPLDSVQKVIDRYDLEAGDLILVDAGTYFLLDDIRIGDLDAGAATNRIVIRGATACGSIGTTLDRQVASGDTAGFRIDLTTGIELQHLTVQNAGSAAIQLYKSPDCAGTALILQGSSNGVGLVETSSFTLQHSVLRNNGNAGINFDKSAAVVRNNVILENPYAFYFQGSSSPSTIENNHLSASGEFVYYVDQSSAIPTANYNNLFLSGPVSVGIKINAIGAPDAYAAVSEWQLSTGQDTHSLSHDPLFVSALSGDYHLTSAAGRFACTGMVMDAATSVLLDGGTPAADFGQEPPPNGGRLNIGRYGNTVEASITPTHARLTAISFNDGGVLDAIRYPTNTLRWLQSGFTNGSLVRVDYSVNNGINWTTISNNVPVEAESVVWSLDSVPDTLSARWRVVSLSHTNVADQTDSSFNIRRLALTIYINDNSTSNDVYTTAVGDIANPGTTNAPLHSLEYVLNEFTLLSGDRVFVDTGVYSISNNMGLSAANQGVDGNPIQIIGSTNRAAGGTWLQRAGTNSGRYGFTMEDTEYIALKYLRLSGAEKGVRIVNSEHITLEQIESFNHQKTGFEINKVQPVTLHRCASWNNGEYGITGINNLSEMYWSHGVMWGNSNGSAYVTGGTLSISNSIVHADGSQAVALFRAGEAAIISGNYNMFWLQNDAKAGEDSYLQEDYPLLEDWQSLTGSQTQSLVQDPLFADASSGDFHLQSEAGRFDTNLQSFVQDAQTSWAIDAGPLDAAFTNEPAFNGGRVNLGMFGNTVEASQSVTNQQEFLIAALDNGGAVDGTKQLYWLSRGFTTSDTLRIEFSADAGVTWDTVVATNELIRSAGFAWTPCADTNTPSSPVSLYRLRYEANTNILTESMVPFLVRCGPIDFFVNDASTIGDVYTSVPGNPSHAGTSPVTPKSSVLGVVNAYDLEPGDTVFIDSGTYPITSQILIGQTDSGSALSPVTFIGNTNNLIGKTVIRQDVGFSGNGLFYLNLAPGIRLSNLVFENATRAVDLYRSDNVYLDHLLIRDSTTGIRMNRSVGGVFDRIIISRAFNPYAVIQSTMTLHDGIAWANTGSAFEMDRSTVYVTNSILYASGVGKRIFNDYSTISASSVDSDYNNLRFMNGAFPARGFGAFDYENLPQWFLETGNDIHSVNLDPLFVDATNDVYLLRSETGRYNPAAESNLTFFGTVQIGQSATNAFVLANDGSSSLVLSGSPAVQVTGAASGDYTVSVQPVTPVPAGTNTTFSVVFSPTTNGLRSASLEIESNDEDESTFTLELQGEGVNP